VDLYCSRVVRLAPAVDRLDVVFDVFEGGVENLRVWFVISGEDAVMLAVLKVNASDVLVDPHLRHVVLGLEVVRVSLHRCRDGVGADVRAATFEVVLHLVNVPVVLVSLR